MSKATLFLLLLGWALWPATAQGQPGERHPEREIIIMLAPEAIVFPPVRADATLEEIPQIDEAILALLRRAGGEHIRRAFPDLSPEDTLITTRDGRRVKRDLLNVFVVPLPENADRARWIDALNETPGVIYAEMNGRVSLRSLPNDPLFSRQWNLRNTGHHGGLPGADIKATGAWEIFTGSSNIVLGIVDGGRVMPNHPDFQGRVSGNLSGVDNSHATHVAGIAAAKGNNGAGIAGVDWHTNITTHTVTIDIADQAAAVMAAVDAGAHVNNNSWGQGTNSFSTTAARAFAYAQKHNVTSSMAMSATYSLEDYPNLYANTVGGMINVGASTNIDTRAVYSLQKDYLDVVAPGGNGDGVTERNILSTVPFSTWLGQYDYAAGTSMAAPHVAGIATLMRGYALDVQQRTLYNDDVINLLKLSSDKVRTDIYSYDVDGWNNNVGFGRVNARRALDLLRAPYDLQHLTASSGATHASSNQYYMRIFDAPGLPSDWYWVRRHDVQKSVTFPYVQSAAHIWCRGTATTGWAADIVLDGWQPTNFTTGWCEPVPGTFAGTSATLRTFVYEVYDPAEYSFIGWYPTEPGAVSFAWSVLRQPHHVAISGPAMLPEGQVGTWTATVTGSAPGNKTYNWYISHDLGITRNLVRQQTTSQTSDNYSQAAYTIGQQHNSFQLIVEVEQDGFLASDMIAVFVQRDDCDPTWELCVGHLVAHELPKEFALEPNYPNPFNPQTEIKYALPEPSTVTLVVVDLLGREIARLVDGPVQAGVHSVNLDASSWSSGVYLYRMEVTGSETGARFLQTRRMTLVK
jgi:hypothetical protein